MYFENRAAAGILLAEQLMNYRYENCAIVALSEGAVLVGEQIAAQLHCVLTLLLTESIDVPGESLSFGAVADGGRFTYNGMFSDGEIYEYTSEFHGYLEEQKRQANQRINRLIGDGGVIDAELLRDRNVIVVSDGFGNDAAIDVAIDFLKPIRIQKLIIAAPVATIPSVDRLHVAADELHILDVKENFMGVNHYYDDNTLPSREETIAKINKMILNWQ